MNNLSTLKEEILNQIQNSECKKSLDDLKVKYLGKKSIIYHMMKNIASLNVEEKKIQGNELNFLRRAIENEIILKKKEIFKKDLDLRLKKEAIDITLPGKNTLINNLHPINQTIHEIENLFSSIGFECIQGPEIENNFYNFDALNIPENHPARSSHDTFFFNDNYLLRTHTSGMQIRVMQEQEPPIQMISTGKVFRNDYDQTHTPMFHQIEGLVVNQNINFSELKGLIQNFLTEFFEKKIKIRFRPSFFPFTEVSAEIDIWNEESSQWLEILGCGMVHPNVFKAVNIDHKKYSGFAFGLGIERLTVLKYNIPDLRMFFENDIRFLQQF